MKEKIAIFWHRRDLRIQDNAGLYQALKSGLPVLPLFIFDKNILDDLEDKKDARVTFIHQYLTKVKRELEVLGASMIVAYGDPIEIWKSLLERYEIAAVYTNRDYEPYALKRDEAVKNILEKHSITFQSYKDQIIFEADEVLKKDGTPYTVFTPYSKRWKAKLASRMSMDSLSFYLKAYPNEKYFKHFHKMNPLPMISLLEIGFEETDIELPGVEISQGLIKQYGEKRNFPAIKGTSRLGVHFRFGTISIREKARKAQPLSEIFLNELIWRDFYSQILSHFPKVVNHAFREKYEAVSWRDSEADFEKWCQGKTGYPIVDAGMRELNATGFMHNRVRMITASFLTKHLLIDWRWGEAYFAQKLLDFDMASNSGGWQWAAGCGTDAAPYFRIFNPYTQQSKFDKDFGYIKKWIPEWETSRYPEAIVEHKFARERCLAAYKEALAKT